MEKLSLIFSILTADDFSLNFDGINEPTLNRISTMKNRYYMITVIAIIMLSFVMAQDPPDLPGAPNQGPIGGMVWLAIGAVVLAVKKYHSQKTDK